MYISSLIMGETYVAYLMINFEVLCLQKLTKLKAQAQQASSGRTGDKTLRHPSRLQAVG